MGNNPDRAVDLNEKFATFAETWSPRVVAELNDIQFKVVKLQGEFVWHAHNDTDEAFLVIRGKMEVVFRDRVVGVEKGQLFVVPKGAEHMTRADGECHAVIIEPRGVVNTGTAGGKLTAQNDRWA